MIDDKSLERLHNSEDFLKFLHYIYGIREWCISQMSTYLRNGFSS